MMPAWTAWRFSKGTWPNDRHNHLGHWVKMTYGIPVFANSVMCVAWSNLPMPYVTPGACFQGQV